MPLIITGIIDGPLSGGVPKAIEFTATEAIADLSVYGVESANNGNGSTGAEYTFPAVSLAAGETFYLASETTGFTQFFGFAPDDTAGVASINGDDAIVLWQGDTRVDVFGAIGTDGTGEAWEYTDGWAYRSGAAPSIVFDPADWTFSGTDALDGEAPNDTAATPFPAGSYSGGGAEPQAPTLVISEVDADQASTDTSEFVELFDGGAGNTSLDGVTLVLFNGNGDAAYDSIALDGYTTDADGYFVIGSEQVANVDLVAWTSNGLQNGADAVALYFGDAPARGDAATTENLIDALVYGTGDPDDAELLAALGQTTQWDESANGDSIGDSLQLQAGGSFAAAAPTSGTGPAAPPVEVTLISEVQGDVGAFDGAVVGVDDVSPLEGQTVIIEAIVTADFQDGLFGDGGDLNGFFLQEEAYDQDGVSTTSEGLFVFDGSNPDVDVRLGDRVRVTGTVGEYFGQTQISAMSVEVLDSGNALPTALEVTLDGSVMVDGSGGYVANLEAYEGMRVTLAQDVAVTEMFNLDRFGEYGVATERFVQYSQTNTPDAEGYDAYLREVAGHSLTFDDGSSKQNPDVLEVIDGNDGILTAADSFRMGDTISDATGVVSYGFDAFRLQNAVGDYTQVNERPDAPEALGGNFTAASVNVLNYFTTIDAPGVTTDNGQDPRGADTPEELERQATKLVDALLAMDADVFGLLEIENDFAGDSFAVKDLVARMNAVAGDGTYAFVDPGQEFVGGDAIANALIYKTAEVRPVGDLAILTEFDGRDFLDPLGAGRDLNRAAIAQTFEDLGTGQEVVVSVNHLKSKGSLSGLEADEDQGDGAGNNNATREAAADILADWLASDPTGSGADKVLILGDLNSYAREDPIRELESEGYVNLAAADDPDAYSYVFDGQVGTLDYALANDALFESFVGATEWHVNADEADALDYNLDFGRDPSLYTADATRYSDHDPIIVSFDLEIEYELIAGTRKKDILFAGEGSSELRGEGGNDLLVGGSKADLLLGGTGNDILLGCGGDDVLNAGAGRDLAYGGDGADTFLFAEAGASDGRRSSLTIFDYEEGVDTLDLSGVDIARVKEGWFHVDLVLEGDGDRIRLYGIDSVDQLTFADDQLLA